MKHRFTVNLSGARMYSKTLHGREYKVVPTVMMVEGVWRGSEGPVFYSAKELAKSCPAWNRKSIVWNHPEDSEGNLISAADPDVIEQNELGFLLNARWEDDKQKTDAWLDVEHCNRIAPSILTRLDRGESVEVSTGLFFDGKVLNNARKHKGKTYTLVARNHRPDHLAVLTDKVGACSVEDGAGLLANRLARDKRRRRPAPANHLTDNALSFSQVHQKLYEALAAKYGQPGKSWYGYVCDVYDDYLIFSDAQGGLQGMQKIGYRRTEDEVTLTGKPVHVERELVYRTDSGDYVGNDASEEVVDSVEDENVAIKDKKKFVTQLIANSGGKLTEVDREALEGMDDKPLELFSARFVGNLGGGDDEGKKKVTPPPPVKQPEDVNEWLKQAPPAIRSVVSDALITANAERTQLIEKITKHPLNKFPKEDLEKSPTANLRALAAFIPDVGQGQPGLPTNGGEAFQPLFGDGAVTANYAPAAGMAPANYGPANPNNPYGIVGNYNLDTPIIEFPNPFAPAK